MKLSTEQRFDAIVLGGGFYGCCIALLLSQSGQRVLIIEKEHGLLLRASAINQARVHNGYHYPRSVITAVRSRINFPRFVADFKEAIVDDFTKVYAISRYASKINAQQFFNFFHKIGAEIEKAPKNIASLFDSHLIEGSFIVNEVAFDASILRAKIKKKLAGNHVEILLDKDVYSVTAGNNYNLVVTLSNGEKYSAGSVFNCLYSRINLLLAHSGYSLLPLKHEVTEMALVETPEQLKKIGVTVMDGPFFSLMPYPSERLHSLSHVRYTPHLSWSDEDPLIDGHAMLRNHPPRSNFQYMVKDASRYMPILQELKYRQSIYEIKTVLKRNEGDDGRPILFRQESGLPGLFSIMGGKIDNIYDILEFIAERKSNLNITRAQISEVFH
ncbi:MAG: FAD-binding oxidoreductase [Polaromonas sp.]|nr:FAD-binding oxidoreductase [Polaromonas sp.]